MGVLIGPVDEALASHLGLQEGAGVLVREVVKGSPASQAGLKKYDVLQYFNDQLLVNQPQLQTLVRQAGAGASVKLTLFRGGKKEIVTVSIGEQEHHGHHQPRREQHRDRRQQGPPRHPMSHPNDTHIRGQLRNNDSMQREFQEFRKRMEELKSDSERMREEVERFRNRMQQLRNLHDSPSGKPVSDLPSPGRPKPPGAPEVRIVGPHEGTVTVVGSEGTTVITWKNKDGAGELRVHNGHKHLVARNAEGRVVSAGPVDTPEQRQQLPAPVREQLERIEKGMTAGSLPGNTGAAQSPPNVKVP